MLREDEAARLGEEDFAEVAVFGFLLENFAEVTLFVFFYWNIGGALFWISFSIFWGGGIFLFFFGKEILLFTSLFEDLGGGF